MHNPEMSLLKHMTIPTKSARGSQDAIVAGISATPGRELGRLKHLCKHPHTMTAFVRL